MNYKEKYYKYKKKYLHLKRLQKGGSFIIETDNTNFLEGYNEINNSGQHNCGIYISLDNKKIIKCKCDPNEKLDFIIEKYPDYKIFPKVFNYYLYKKDDEKTFYCKMEKFEGDVTELLYELLPQQILNKMVEEQIITENDKNNYYNIFFLLIPKTIGKKQLNVIKITPLDKYLYNHPEEISLVEEIAKKNYENQYIRNDNMIQKYKDYTIRYINDSSKTYHSLKEIVSLFKDIDFNYDKYEEFIRRYKKIFNEIITSIRKQIIRLEILLLIIGLEYSDFKLDNFAFTLSSNNYSHLGIIWNNNNFDNKYFFIHIIDPDSGLFKLSKQHINYYLKRFNPTKYGQYEYNIIQDKILYNYDENFLNLSEDVIKLLTKSNNLDKLSDLDIEIEIDKLEDYNNYVLEDNNYIQEIEDTNNIKLKKLIESYKIDQELQDKIDQELQDKNDQELQDKINQELQYKFVEEDDSKLINSMMLELKRDYDNYDSDY